MAQKTGVCIHCHSPIVELDDLIPPTWYHESRTVGFRTLECRTGGTVATPTTTN